MACRFKAGDRVRRIGSREHQDDTVGIVVEVNFHGPTDVGVYSCSYGVEFSSGRKVILKDDELELAPAE